MATAIEVVSRLADRGITFQIEDSGGLRVNGVSRLTEREKVALRVSRSAILRALTATPTAYIADSASTPVAPDLAVTAASIAVRQPMPQIAAVVDQLKAVFGPVRVIYVVENGCELGKAPDPGVIAHPPHVPSKSRKRGQL